FHAISVPAGPRVAHARINNAPVRYSHMIRPLRPTDVVALSGLHDQAALFEVTAHTWPRVQPESHHLSYLGLLSHALTRPIDRRGTWILEHDGTIAGLVVGQGRARGLVWDVEHLYAKEDRDACALLD